MEQYYKCDMNVMNLMNLINSNENNLTITIKSDFKGLLKEYKFFNKFVLDNRPMNVIANYKEVSKHF